MEGGKQKTRPFLIALCAGFKAFLVSDLPMSK
jgi:hypothetical protein